MKKSLILLAVVSLVMSSCMTTMGTAGQGTATSGQNTQNAGQAVGNILQSVLGLNKLSKAELIGTWAYSQPGCAFSSENQLAQAGGELVAADIKARLAPSYKKIGVKASNTQVTFNQDGTFAATFAGQAFNGTYTYDEATAKISMQGLLLNINCYAKRNTDGIGLLFESSKLLTLLQTMSATSGNATATTIGDIMKSYDGLRVGFDMKH